MPLTKRSPTDGSAVSETITPEKAPKIEPQAALGSAKAQDPIAKHTRETSMTKDDYWRRREERDIERDKHMAWSGLAQAALGSVSVAQLNTDNTEDGLVSLVSRIVDKLLKVRDSR